MMTNEKTTAFIFARGGSKGVKNKNIRIVANKPLLAHTIEAAMKARYINNVIVSTDCPKIAQVAKQFGADVLVRPEDLAGDRSPEILSWRHAILETIDQADLDFVSLPPTSPLRSSADIDRSIAEFRKRQCDILFGITESHRNPYLNMVTINREQHLEIVLAGSGASRRQDVPAVFDVTTCVYVANRSYLAKCGSIMEGRVGYIKIPSERSLDIDTEFDLHLADLLLAAPFTDRNTSDDKR